MGLKFGHDHDIPVLMIFRLNVSAPHKFHAQIHHCAMSTTLANFRWVDPAPLRHELTYINAVSKYRRVGDCKLYVNFTITQVLAELINSRETNCSQH